ncbi:MAG: hypothetical protein KGP14_09160, partial [Betaproteobacteria bacterium]|nr:hypothetical protein [Betaproteobacteria bacterium]
ARADLADAVAARDCEAIASAISTGRTKVGRIERAEFAIWAAATGMRAKIEDHASNQASPLRSIALSLRDFILGAANALDFSIPANVAALQAWVAAGELDQSSHDALIAGATVADLVTAQQVAEALFNADGSLK